MRDGNMCSTRGSYRGTKSQCGSQPTVTPQTGRKPEMWGPLCRKAVRVQKVLAHRLDIACPGPGKVFGGFLSKPARNASWQRPARRRYTAAPGARGAGELMGFAVSSMEKESISHPQLDVDGARAFMMLGA